MKKYSIYLFLFAVISCDNIKNSFNENTTFEKINETKLKIDSVIFSNEGGIIFSIKSNDHNLYGLTDEAILMIDSTGKILNQKYLLPKNKNVADFDICEENNTKTIYLSNMDSVLICNENLTLKNGYKGNQYFTRNEKYLIFNSSENNGIKVINRTNNSEHIIKDDKLMLGVIYNNLLYNLNDEKTLKVYDLNFNKNETNITLKDSTISFIAGFIIKENAIGIVDVNDQQMFYKVFSKNGLLLEKHLIPIDINDISPSLSDYSPSLVEALQKLIIFSNSKNSFCILMPTKMKKNKLYKISLNN